MEMSLFSAVLSPSLGKWELWCAHDTALAADAGVSCLENQQCFSLENCCIECCVKQMLVLE